MVSAPPIDQTIVWTETFQDCSAPSDDACLLIRVLVEPFSRGLTTEKKEEGKKSHPTLQKHFWCFPSVFPGHSCISSFVKNTDSETILETMPAGGSLKLNTTARRPVGPLIACYSTPHPTTPHPTTTTPLVCMMLVFSGARGNTKQLFPPNLISALMLNLNTTVWALTKASEDPTFAQQCM